jgi:hypothetical protein
MATFRKSTLVIVSVRSAYYENERFPSLEVKQAGRPQTEEEVLPKQAALQEMPGSGPSGAEGRAKRDPRQAAGQGVHASTKVLIIPVFGRTVVSSGSRA